MTKHMLNPVCLRRCNMHYHWVSRICVICGEPIEYVNGGEYYFDAWRGEHYHVDCVES